ncbi:MAG TPA: hypothetical protein VF624_07185 [Tepidisphaeraceae bacterium]|jgi:type I restriction enzyme R subunit
MTSDERQLEEELLEKLRGLKYEHRPDIRERAALDKNFRAKFQALNRVKLTDVEFDRLLAEIVTGASSPPPTPSATATTSRPTTARR